MMQDAMPVSPAKTKMYNHDVSLSPPPQPHCHLSISTISPVDFSFTTQTFGDTTTVVSSSLSRQGITLSPTVILLGAELLCYSH